MSAKKQSDHVSDVTSETRDPQTPAMFNIHACLPTLEIHPKQTEDGERPIRREWPNTCMFVRWKSYQNNQHAPKANLSIMNDASAT